MGLEKLLASRFGSMPQIDLDRQLARVRVLKPTTLDFTELAKGVRQNNMGCGGFLFQANVLVREGRVEIQETTQVFPLAGAVHASSESSWRTLKVLDWEDFSRTRVEIVP